MHLIANKRKTSFLGEIMDKRLSEVMNFHCLINMIVRRILGEEFLFTKHKYRVNTEMPTVFNGHPSACRCPQ